MKIIRHKLGHSTLAVGSAIVLMAASGNAMACSKGKHSAVAQYVEITVKNHTDAALSATINEDGRVRSSGNIIAGKSMSWNTAMDATDIAYFTTTLGSIGDVQFKVTNDQGTKFESTMKVDGVDCSKDWGSTNKVWKVTYTVK